MQAHQWLLLSVTVVAAVLQHSSAAPPRPRPAPPAPVVSFGFDSIQRLARRHLKEPEFITLSTDNVAPSDITHYVYFVGSA